MTSQASLAEAAAVALSSLRASKLRSFLTLLGIILATTTLIAVMSVIHGMNLYIAKQVSDMGADGFRVRRIIMIGNFDAKKFMEMQRRNPEMSREEFEFIKAQRKACPRDRDGSVPRRAGEVRRTGDSTGFSASGATPNMDVISNMQVVSGRFISANDDSTRLSSRVHRQRPERAVLSERRSRSGKTIAIDGRPLRSDRSRRRR